MLRKIAAATLLLTPSAWANPLPDKVLSSRAIIDQAISALGGEQALHGLRGVTYHASKVFRSRSLMQSYELYNADTAVAVTGNQDVSFSFTTDQLQQRIDRQFVPSDYWTWGSGTLDRLNFSLVVRGGADGFACYNRGNNQIWLPVNITSGYTDAALAEYFVLHGIMMSPKLLLQMKSSNATAAHQININDIEMQAVSDTVLNITIIFDPTTSLPYIVRTPEMHPIFGDSTNDLVLSNYTAAVNSTLLFPQHIQTVYNATSTPLDAVLEDFVVDSVEVDPAFSADFFGGIPEDQSFFPKSAPRKEEGVSHALLTEFSSNMLWSGTTKATAETLKADTPISALPNVHWLILDEDSLGVKQLIIEFDSEVIVGDAAPQWSKSVIAWVKEKIGKPITYVFPTHHHRDHSGGAPDYVAAGAKLIVPEVAAQYWTNIPGAELVTFNDTHPYVHRDSKTQAWFIWEDHATHAVDWAYAFVTTLCPNSDSPAAVFEADAWHGGVLLENNNQLWMRQWLNQVRRDGLTRDAIVLPTHGQVKPLTDLIAETGYAYPNLTTADWRAGAAMC